ncbi:MAG: class IV adenylate cyclase [Candidatus Heimdallarchaeota archaeon]
MYDIEIKARCDYHDQIREILIAMGARFGGIDEQTDVYFKTNIGRLKLRKGNIEGALVFYKRENVTGIKVSKYTLYESKDPVTIERILRETLGVLIEVVKTREMYFIDNVKFNIDIVQGLGKFIEIEAMTNDKAEFDELKTVVQGYLDKFRIQPEAIQSHSYSDLLLKK